MRIKSHSAARVKTSKRHGVDCHADTRLLWQAPLRQCAAGVARHPARQGVAGTQDRQGLGGLQVRGVRAFSYRQVVSALEGVAQVRGLT
jgi:hypothetical protein